MSVLPPVSVPSNGNSCSTLDLTRGHSHIWADRCSHSVHTRASTGVHTGSPHMLTLVSHSSSQMLTQEPSRYTLACTDAHGDRMSPASHVDSWTTDTYTPTFLFVCTQDTREYTCTNTNTHMQPASAHMLTHKITALAHSWIHEGGSDIHVFTHKHPSTGPFCL